MRLHLPSGLERWCRRGCDAVLWLWRAGCVLLVSAAVIIGTVILVGNVFLGSDRDVPYRALDPDSEVCRAALATDTDILARREGAGVPPGGVGNDEWAALDVLGPASRPRFSCAVQRHVIPGYRAADGTLREISYDIAFVEFEESGKPYQVRVPCDPPKPCGADGCGADRCRDEGYGPVQNGNRSQLVAVRKHLDPSRPNYVLGFIHGWRHSAEVGDSNVGDVRHYAAHVARFMEDRFGKDDPEKPHVTALYVGWRGARTDETWLRRSLGGSRLGETWVNDWLRQIAEWIGTVSALPTLFDRKPVSEAIAPAALSALRDIEQHLGIEVALPAVDGLPDAKPRSRMIVFGHSLGGNMLATALHDDLLKKVERHPGSGRYMLPPLGDLVVLINPAAEASKWIAIQRAVWNRTPMSFSERAQTEDYVSGKAFFRAEQRPILVSVTAARDWPPGGRTEVDCDLGGDKELETTLEKSRKLVRDSVEYDWATYDLFPASKWDFRPVADTLTRWGSGKDPHDRCAPRVERSWGRQVFGLPAIAVGKALRVLPFMRTDIEETRTIGHVDPVRAAQGGLKQNAFAARPLGTTHELRGWLDSDDRTRRKVCDASRRLDCGERTREIPIDYLEVTEPAAGCPVARSWLGLARAQQPAGQWSSDSAGDQAPALRFLHGFSAAGIAPITRPNDPFWNMRAFDTALARHDGFMLSSFICAMNQLVMDDITDFSVPPSVEATLPAEVPMPEQQVGRR